jgi:alpha-glucosidase
MMSKIMQGCGFVLCLFFIRPEMVEAREMVLEAKNATIHGNGAFYNDQKDRNAISQWKDVNTWISWDVQLTEPADVEIFISQELSYTATGCDFEVHIGQEILTASISSDTDYEGFVEHCIGKIKLNKTGNYTVKLIPKSFKESSFFPDTRGLILRTVSGPVQSIKPFRDVRLEKTEFFNKHTAVFYPEGYDEAKHGRSFALCKEPTIIGEAPSSWKLTPYFESNGSKSRVTMDISEGTSLYGTGEVLGRLERSDTKITLYNFNNYSYARSRTSLYQSHPWIMGVRRDGTAFGFLADTTWRSELVLHQKITFTSDAPLFRVIVLDRESPQAVMKALAELTGTMEMPPLWTLGYQQCRYSYVPDTQVRKIADEFRKRKLPCDVIWIDIDYMDGYRIFTVDKTKFPNPRETNEYLHSLGFKGVWMIDPGVKVEQGYDVYDSGTERNVWVQTKDGKEYHGRVWPGMCAFPDFTRPETRQWWAELHKAFMAHGVDGIWNDVNEPTVFDTHNKTMPDDNWHRGGGGILPGPHLKYHNIYGMLMVKATRDGVLAANPGKRPFVLTRSNFLGGHRYAATWTGDNKSNWSHLKMSIPMSLNLGLSGQPFNGPDIGGFAGRAEAELFGHWISLGAFYPFSRGHANKGTQHKEPWQFGREIEEVARIALERRYRLLPYLYTLFNEASQNGMPVMRPVFFADPSNQALRQEDQLFLLGKDLLVIPKWAKSPVIPKGYDASVSLVGEDSAGDPYQCDLKIRNGSIVPLTEVIQNTTAYDHRDLTLLIRLDDNGNAEGTLYEDANDGFGYKTGEYRRTFFRAEKSGAKLILTRSVEGSFQIGKRSIKLEIITDHGIRKGSVSEDDDMTLNLE